MRRIPIIGNFRIDDTTGCWNWAGTKGHCGYGKTTYLGENMHVSRAMAAMYLGLNHRDKNSFALHRCDNPACINPKHIFIGTQVDNMKDAVSKRRHRNQKKTHCVNGHEFTADNIYITTTGARSCRKCISKATRRWEQRKRGRRI